jgi:hypothetical protein
VRADTAGRRTARFRVQFWRLFIAMAVVVQAALALLVGVQVLAGGTVTVGPLLVGWATSAVLLPAGTLLVVLVWPVQVCPDCLRASDAWGFIRAVRWDAVRDARPINLAGLPYLRVYPADTRRVLWVPLFLADYRRFAELVAAYAGPDHPVAREARRRIEEE